MSEATTKIVTQETALESLYKLVDFVTNFDKDLSAGMGADILKLYGIWQRKTDRLPNETFRDYVSPLLDRLVDLLNGATNKAFDGFHLPNNCIVSELAHNSVPQAARRLIGTDRTPNTLRKLIKDKRTSNPLGEFRAPIKASKAA